MQALPLLYFSDPAARVSKTLINCNEEFGEKKGFETAGTKKKKAS